jgi:hypothetical protein
MIDSGLGENPRHIENTLDPGGLMLKLVRTFGLVLFTLIFVSQNCFAQGLAERRAIKEYQETKYPALKTQIDSAAGFEAPISVDWEKIALAGDAENYMSDGYLTNIFFIPLIAAFKEVTADAMGKTALKEKLKGITLTYDSETAPSSNYANGLTFENGMLTVNFKPWSNSDDIKERTEAIRTLLETNL